MTMFPTLSLDLVIFPTSCKPDLQLEAGPADQIPHSVGWWAQAAWLLCFGAVPRHLLGRGPARQQQSLTSRSSRRQAGALCKLGARWRHLAAEKPNCGSL